MFLDMSKYIFSESWFNTLYIEIFFLSKIRITKNALFFFRKLQLSKVFL